MANLPKKSSQRAVGAGAKASASGRSTNAASSRLRPSVKVPKSAPEPEPEPEVEEVQEIAEEVQEAPAPEGDSLLGELEEAVIAVPKREGMPLKADEHLLSDNSLYGDDDPLEKAKQKKMMNKPVAPTKASVRAPASTSQKKAKAAESSGTAEAVEAAPEAAAEKPKSGDAKKTKPGSDSRVMKSAKPKEDEAAEAAPAAIEDDAEPVEETRTLKKQSGKSNSRAMKGGSRRMEKAAEEEEDPSNRVSRRTTKRSIRGKSAGGGLTKMHKIGAIAGVVVLLVIVAGYSPFMKWLYSKSIMGPDVAVEARRSAAKSLVEFDSGSGYEVCGQAMLNPDANIREAGVYGMGLLGKAKGMRSLAISSFTTALGTAEAATKAQIIRAMGEIAEDTNKAAAADKEAKSDEKLKEDNNDLNALATAIMPHAEASSEPTAEVRAAAVENLKALRVPGVCKMLIKIATSGDADLKSKARDGIPTTALPDSAGALLEAVGGPDKSLSAVCKAAFEFVRDSAKSEVLAALVTDPSDDVRQEVVKALAKRSNDTAAAAGLIHAFKDKVPEIRAAAVKGIPTTGMVGSVQPIADLVNDPDENVRVETGNTLGELRDSESAKMVLEAFKNPMSGKTMSAFVTALGKRTSGKDLKACAIVMNILERNPSAEASVKEALALLTQANQGSGRINQRRGWSIEKWKGWWTNISERESLRKAAIEKLEALKKHKDDDHTTFPGLMREVEAQLDILEKCTDMSMTDDPEDVPLLRDQQHQYTFLKEHFLKNASLDMRNGQ